MKVILVLGWLALAISSSLGASCANRAVTVSSDQVILIRAKADGFTVYTSSGIDKITDLSVVAKDGWTLQPPTPSNELLEKQSVSYFASKVDGKEEPANGIISLNVVTPDLDHELWFMNDAKPNKYHTSAILKIKEFPADVQLQWEVSQGADIARLGENNDIVVNTFSGNSVVINTIWSSRVKDDVIVTIRYSGSDICATTLTVRTPYHAIFRSKYDERVSLPSAGYNTYYTFSSIKDQFNVTLPYDIFFREEFGAFTPDVANNWGSPDNKSFVLHAGKGFKDRYGIQDRILPPYYTPTPIYMSTGTVQHAYQSYYVGSGQPSGTTGVEIGFHIVQYYIGFARQIPEP